VDLPAAALSADELAGAVERNLYALFRSMVAALPGSEINETDRFSRHFAFPTNPMFKGVWGTRLNPDAVDEVIDDSIAWFKAREAPFFFWWTGPATEPSDLGERLMRRGLISMEEQQREMAHGIVQTARGAPGMVADLYEAPESVLDEVPPGFEIEEVLHERSLHDFRGVFVDVYGIPAWAGQAWVDATLRVGVGRTPWRMFLGRLNGVPVATNMLFTGAGVASVYAVGTRADARGKGIGGAITLKPLLEARAQGYRYAVLFSTELGIGAYERIGFRQTDVRINRFLWRNA
jgi:ribosomal protein S18 acetylase RimI-like enzyme